MLGKLIKYEYRATVGMFVPIIAAYLAITGLMRLIGLIKTDFIVFTIFSVLIGLVFQLVNMVVSFLPLVASIRRFRKNILGDEGYLMNTLPVRTSSLIFSKFIVAFTWYIACSLAAVLSTIILLAGQQGVNDLLAELNILISTAAPFLTSPGFITLLIACIVLSSMFMIFMFYASLVVGHLANKNKMLKSVGVFFGIFIVNIFLIVLAFWIMTQACPDPTNEQAIYMTLGLLTGYSAVFSAIFYLITSVIMKKKLNLE